MLTANGKEIPILKTVTPVRFNGQDYLLESFVDITERKRTEKELRNLNDGMVRMEIRDNGIGIKREQFKNAFVMFRRLNSRDEYEGTGIGLAVCKRIVERYGGQIGIESIYGQGSTFWFTVPAADRVVTQETESLTAMTAR